MQPVFSWCPSPTSASRSTSASPDDRGVRLRHARPALVSPTFRCRRSASATRQRAALTSRSSDSQPTNRLPPPTSIVATAVVPEPASKSQTVAPGRLREVSNDFFDESEG
jgi:hypothetical protein